VSQFVAQELERAGIAPQSIDIVRDAVDVARGTAAWNDQFPAIALPFQDPEKGRDLIEAAVKQSGIEVVFADDLPTALSRASMFVYVTRSEGLGSAALVAMQMGVPVIASKVGGLAEVFEDGLSGLYVQNEPGEIARAMRRILASRTLAQTLIENAFGRIDALFTPERLVTATLASYEKALAT
jgi:glycosyltransferase involved in cell wall biosynthesis